MGKIFAKKERQKVFEETEQELRKIFPNATETFIRGTAWSKARQTPVPKPVKKPRARMSVAQTYKAPTRAERQEDHEKKMQRKHRTNKWRLI